MKPNVSAREAVATHGLTRAQAAIGAGLAAACQIAVLVRLAARSETDVRGGCEGARSARRARACVGRSLHSGTQRVACRRQVYLGVASSRSQRSHVCSLCCARGVRLSHARASGDCLCTQRRACGNGRGRVHQADLRSLRESCTVRRCSRGRACTCTRTRTRTRIRTRTRTRTRTPCAAVDRRSCRLPGGQAAGAALARDR
jgi:hypothetical protein